jgi:tRNA modification GTPase
VSLTNFVKIISKNIHFFLYRCGNPTRECPVLSHARHRHHLEQCVNCLLDYRDYMSSDNACQDLAIAAQKLRSAMRSIGKVIGEVCTEDVLDIIFKDFCIGK